MTYEQADQLKEGDEIFIRTKFLHRDRDGDIVYRSVYGCIHKAVDEAYTIPEFALLPSDLQQLAEKPKYDPCRLFREGDKVKYTPRNGRDFFNTPWIYDAAEVIEDEARCGAVVVRFTFNYGESAVCNVPWYYLQLVTPVEELEPYSVEVDEDEWHILRGGKFLMSFPFDSDAYYTEEQAKAAAEAECARLNAKHRKEQK